MLPKQSQIHPAGGQAHWIVELVIAIPFIHVKITP